MTNDTNSPEHESAVQAEADRIVTRLDAAEQTWAALPLSERIELLERLGRLTEEHAQQWVEEACRIKQLPADSPLVGEEWISGPWAVLTFVPALAETLRRLDAGKDVLSGFHTRTVGEDQVAVDVLPHNLYDRLLLNGYTATVWMERGVTEADVRREAGLTQRDPAATRGSTLVLGAGNIFSIAPLDVLYMLYAENRVAVLKLNPIAEALEPVLRAIFAPFLELGVVEIITGGVEIGARLAHHPGISAVHMTGSERTHDAIVWGPGAEGEERKQAGTPLLDKPISSELGGVAPVIIVPGKWSEADLEHQAQHVATMRLHNSGFNCIAGQVVVLSSEWEQKDDFLAALRRALSAAPHRPPWYPGCADRVSAARGLHPSSEAVGGTPERTLIPGLDLTDATESAFQEEYFGPVLGVAELPGHGEHFLRSAVDAANERLHGTLGANVILDPATMKYLGTALEEQIARLRYGTIGVNAWTGLGYLTAHATWGAFPGHPLDDIQSGRGVVHNALLLARTERTVVRGPFRTSPRSVMHGELTISPKPPWFVNNRTAAGTGRLLSEFAASPSVAKLPGIFVSALRG
ncbi:aldehyde dehydrogenase family protein [Nocardioides insulae]|uniref:aldehyde dehydrogenase family protein n=1 Tax=Nocardioides insulae TaxID=394734 RepID=UPI00040BDA5C|nr:aldehyde dehydrogenase family protein [Nocardioides insulae]